MPLEAAASHPFLARELKACIERDGYSFRQTASDHSGVDRRCGLVAVWISWNAICQDRGWDCMTDTEMAELLGGREYWQKVQERDPAGNTGVDWEREEDLDANQLSLIGQILGDRVGMDTYVEVCQQREPESFQHKVYAIGHSEHAIKIRLHHNAGHGAAGHWSGFGHARSPAQSQIAGQSPVGPQMPQPSVRARYPREDMQSTRAQADVPSEAELQARRHQLHTLWDQACERHEHIRRQATAQNGSNKISDRNFEMALSQDPTMARLRREVNDAHAGFKCSHNMSPEQDNYAHVLLQLVGNEARPDGSRKPRRNKVCAQILGMQPNTFTKLISTIVKTTSGGKVTGEDLRRKKSQIKREAKLDSFAHDSSPPEDQYQSRCDLLESDASHQASVGCEEGDGNGFVAQHNDMDPTWDEAVEQVRQLVSESCDSTSYTPDHGEVSAPVTFGSYQVQVDRDQFANHTYAAPSLAAEDPAILDNELDQNGIEPNSGIDFNFAHLTDGDLSTEYQQVHSDPANSPQQMQSLGDFDSFLFGESLDFGALLSSNDPTNSTLEFDSFPDWMESSRGWTG